MKIGILGYGMQNQSALNYFFDGQNQITICDPDINLKLTEGVNGQLGDGYLENLEKFDLLVRSPIIHPKKLAHISPDKITTNTNEFFKACPSKNIIGVTGTKGKGTTSTLITKMLEAAGKRVHLGGNIGIPPLDLLNAGIHKDDYVVLEIASFQLIDLKYSPHIAVCVMVEGEHLDWHKDIDEYVMAKQQLFRWQKPEDLAIYYKLNELSKKVASVSTGTEIPYFDEGTCYEKDGFIWVYGQKLCAVDEVKLMGQHNWQNICAAATAVWQVEQNFDAIRSVATTMSGLPFRIEKRGEKHGVYYYNDSFCSAPAATIAAVLSIPRNKVLIIGGFERGLSLTDLANTLKSEEETINQVVVIGQTAERVAGGLKEVNFNKFTITKAKTMPEIIALASSFAKPGDAVLLSPGFASFDMFKNFEDRGIKFNEAVDTL